MNAPKTEWWPRLGFLYIAGLDNGVDIYDKEGLGHLADALDSDKAHRTVSAMSAARIIQQLADTPAAIKAMNNRRLHGIVNMNRVAHFLVRRERKTKMGKTQSREESLYEVAEIWKTKSDTVSRDADQLRAKARRIVDNRIDDLLARPDALPRAKILEDFDADMVDRAARMSSSAGRP